MNNGKFVAYTNDNYKMYLTNELIITSSHLTVRVARVRTIYEENVGIVATFLKNDLADFDSV